MYRTNGDDRDRQRYGEQKSSKALSKYSKGLELDSNSLNLDIEQESEKFKFKSSSNENVSQLEELNPKTLEFNKLVEFLPKRFLEEYLKKILAFLKGGSKELCFPNIAPFREAFLVKLAVDKNNLRCDRFGSSCRSVCRDIVKVLDSNKHAYQWIYSYESGIEKKDVLVYQKEFINNKKLDSDGNHLFKVPRSISLDKGSRHSSSHNIDLSNAEEDIKWINGRDGHQNPANLTKKQRNYKELFDSVTLPFIMSSLQDVIDFMDDDKRLTLEFKDVTSHEARFLKCVNIFPLKDSLSCLLDKECLSLVREMRKCLDTRGLKVSEGKASGRSRLRTVTIKKRSNSNHGKGSSDQWSSSRRRRRSEETTSYDPGAMFRKALSTSTDSDDSIDKTEKSHSSRGREDVQPSNDRRRGRNRLKYSGQSQPGILWQPATAAPATPPGTPPPPATPAATPGTPPPPAARPKRRSKLAEALSVPVEIDVAVKMMRRMGWKGGALGARGGGIVEPIMPSIDIVQGAGLGHSRGCAKPSERQNRTGRKRKPPDFRLDILKHLLHFIRDPEMQTMVEDYNASITRQEQSFLRVATNNINARQSYSLASSAEQETVDKILSAIRDNADLKINLDISDRSRRITFQKETCRRPARRRRKTKSSSAPKDSPLPPINYPKLRNKVVVTNADIQTRIEAIKTDISPNKTSLNGLAYRITVFQQILDFVRCTHDDRSVVFRDVLLTSKQTKFIDNIVDNINKKTKCSYSTAVENGLFDKIKAEIDCSLKLTLSSDYRYFTLRKFNFIKSGPKLKSAVIKSNGVNNNSINNNNKKDVPVSITNTVLVEKSNDPNSVVVSDSEGSIISLECNDRLSSDDEVPNVDDETVKSEIEEKDVADMKAESYGDELDNADADENNDANNGARLENCECVCTETVEDAKITSEIEDEIANVSLNCNFDVELAEELKDNSVCDLKAIQANENIQITTETEVKMLEEGDDLKSENLKECENKREDIEDLTEKREENNTEIPMDIDIKTLDKVTLEQSKLCEIKDCTKNTAVEIKYNGKITDIATNAGNDRVTCNLIQKDYNEDILDHKVERNKGTSEDNVPYFEVPSPGSGKRSRSMSQSSDIFESKRVKMRTDLKEIYVVIANNSKKDLDRQLAAKIQEELLKSIEDATELPYLKCHGLIDGVLHYECGNTDSMEFLKDCIQKVFIADVSLTVFESSKEAISEKRNRIKMAVKTNSFLVEDPKNIFKRIELYNSGIRTENWIILNEAKNNVFNIEIDNNSFEVISEFNYCLYAGIDRVEFSRIW